jgi:hypothetical protein
MRRALDAALAAPGLTRGRFIALACVSLLATSTVVTAALRSDGTPYALLAAAQARPAPVVEVTPAPRAVPAVAAPVPDAPVADTTPAAAADVPAAASTPAVSQPAVTSTPAPAKQPAPATLPAPAKKPASKIKHVFVVDIAGKDHEATWGDQSAATYLNGTLRPQGTFLGGYHALAQGELASLVALTSGQKPTPGIEHGCPVYSGDCLFPIETLSLADQLVSGGLRWRAYAEDLSNGPDAAKSCRHPAPDAADDTAQGRPGDEYATRHNPFVYYRSLTELGECMTNDLPLTALDDDLKTADATPNFSFIAPNLCHGGWEETCADGSPGGLAPADAFLAGSVPKILESAAYKRDGMLVVLSDTGALVLSPLLPANARDDSQVDAYSLLRYLEDLFGLDYLGGAAQAVPLTLAVPLE